MMEVNRDGQGRRQGWSWQEGQTQEGQQAVRPLIFEELAFGREDLFMTDQKIIDTRPVCVICAATEDQHEGRRHAFTPEGTRVDTSQFGPRRSERKGQGDDASRRIPSAHIAAQTPFDPVLRQALISKGILSVQDLADAEAMINALTNGMIPPSPRPRSRGIDE